MSFDSLVSRCFDTVISIGFGFWFFLTIVRQFKKHAVRDPLNVVPLWTFFAPNPGHFDYHLVYRDLSPEDQPVAPWAEIMPPERRSLSTALWNPSKRMRKATIDGCQALSGLGDADEARLTVPYLMFLNLVMNRPAAQGAASRQFMLVATRQFGSSAPQALFRSESHAL